MSENENDEVMWKVKDDTGAVFGPATMASLQSWARGGRLAPSHTISCDDENWLPVTSCRELAMDWIVELSPGKLYGPIHREACDELIANGTLTPEVPQFARVHTSGKSPETLEAENASLLSCLETLRSSFAERMGDLEARLSESNSQVADLKAQLETRDLDFEAERQGLAAAEIKLKSELARAEKKAASSEEMMVAISEREKANAADKALIEELNMKIADFEEKLKLQKQDFDQRSSSDKAEIRRLQADLDDANAHLKTLRVREESMRKLVQQATQIFAGASTQSADDEEIVVS